MSGNVTGKIRFRLVRVAVVAVAVLTTGEPTAKGQCQLSKLFADDAEISDQFGHTVAISDDWIVIGTPFEDHAGMTSGAVYVFRRDGNHWVEQQKLTAADASSGDRFGRGVSIDKDVIVVGATRDNEAAVSAGAAYVFRFDGSHWNQQQKITASDAIEEDGFGDAIGISGNVIVVGAIGHDTPPFQESGAAYVYRFNGIMWVEEQELTASDIGLARQFGTSAAAVGDTVLVGLSNADQAAGAIYVFDYDGKNWVETQRLVASDAAANARFGESISMNGDWAIIGAFGDGCTNGGDRCGAAYMFRRSETGWIEDVKLTASDIGPRGLFGFSVSISNRVAIVGAIRSNCLNGPDCGAAYVY